MPHNKITKEYFFEEYHRFRKIMCSTEYDPEQKMDSFKGLLFVYVNLDNNLSPEDNDMIITTMASLEAEVSQRLGYQMAMEIQALFAEANER